MQDMVTMTVSPFPLGYHEHSWQVAAFTPYFLDQCPDTKHAEGCSINDYNDFAFASQGDILATTWMATDDFKTWWSMQVSDALNVSFPEL